MLSLIIIFNLLFTLEFYFVFCLKIICDVRERRFRIFNARNEQQQQQQDVHDEPRNDDIRPSEDPADVVVIIK